MILHCNFEEIQALKNGATAFLGLEPGSEMIPVAAPPLAKARVESLLGHLNGDLSVHTLADQRQFESGVRTVVEFLQGEMKSLIADHSPTDEGAMDAYMDFATAYSVLARLRRMGREMEAMVEVIVGGPVTPELERSFEFPD